MVRPEDVLTFWLDEVGPEGWYKQDDALYAQIRQGAPFDAFFSADEDKPARLERAGFAAPGSRFTYAIGRLVLWSASDRWPIGGAAPLTDARVRRVAMANPRLAPYGAAALAALRHLGLEASIRHKLVFGENVTQAYQFVSTGNAEMGFVAAAQVYADGRLAAGAGWLVPTDHHAPLRQDAVLLRRGVDNPAAPGLLAFISGDAGRDLLPGWGYDLPPLGMTAGGAP